MKLARFEIFREEVSGHQSIVALVEAVLFYYYYDEKWWDEDNSPVAGTRKSTLDRLRSNKTKQWRAKSSKDTYLYVENFDAVVLCITPNPARVETREKIRTYIDEAKVRADHAYGATHQKLTGLINKESFIASVKHQIQEINKVDDESAAQDVEIKNNRICVLAIDIDRFKQINDNFGHGYGDVVLQTVARRLEACAKLTRETSGVCSLVQCSHLSGEEFAILLIGSFDSFIEFDLAEKFRQCVGEEILPSDEEWGSLKDSGQILPRELPSHADRSVKISVGLSARDTSDLNDPTDASRNEEALSLMENADVALEKAKGLGRDRTIRFYEISKKFGRIIEHHSATNIVATDLGRRVNVQVGQEFRVYHPDFAGGVPFSFNDGRTQRQLGEYPRTHCGLVEIFDVQGEISFAKVIKNDCVERFANGCLLGAVPLGEINHVVEGRSITERSNPQILENESDFYAIINPEESLNDDFSVFSARLKDAQQLSARIGSSQLNKIIGKFYDELDLFRREEAFISQVEPGHFLIVLPKQINDKIKTWFDKLSAKEIDFGSHDHYFLISLISNNDISDYSTETYSSFEISLRLAKYLSLLADIRNLRVQSQPLKLYPNFADHLAYNLRKLRRRHEVAEFVTFLKDIGILDAATLNQAGLVNYEADEHELALEYFTKGLGLGLGIEEDSEVFYLYLNRGLTYYKEKDYISCYKDFRLVRETQEERFFDSAQIYLQSYGYCLGEIFNNKLDHDTLHVTKEIAIAELSMLAEKLKDNSAHAAAMRLLEIRTRIKK